MWWCVVGLLLVEASAVLGEDWRVVNIEQGAVRGRRDPDSDLYVFYNIPYATAPTGRKKFQAPLPPPKWTTTFDATDKNVICPQAGPAFGIDLTKKTVQEDCLIANIYVPDTPEKNLPVAVFIHGGAFQAGYGDWLKPTNLMQSKEFIAVNFNYRLGIHGFLCLGTKDAQGNAGMKDMVALLQWVKKNIASFGGNPDDVTLSGFSAGAAAVEMLTLCKGAVGLFDKVIVESGASTATFSIGIDPVNSAKAFAKKLKFTNSNDINALAEFYMTASYDTLTSDTFLDRADSTFAFVPCIERNVGEEVFLDDSPMNILKKGDFTKVPTLVGFTNMEGLFRVPLFSLWQERMDKKFSEFLPANLKFKSPSEREKVSQQIREYYFKDKPVDTTTVLSYVDYFTDVLFAIPALMSIKLNVESGNSEVYVFEYSFVDEDTPFVPFTMTRGATHCAETMAVLDGINFQPDESIGSDEYKQFRKKIRELWLNFILTGKPVPAGSSLPAWPPASPNGSPHMSLGTTLELRGTPLEDRVQFWRNIYDKHYREAKPAGQRNYRSTDLDLTNVYFDMINRLGELARTVASSLFPAR